MPRLHIYALTPLGQDAMPSITGLLNELAHIERCKLLTASLVELALEFHPMQPQRVQEALQDVHAHEHAQGDTEPGSKHEIDHDTICREWHLQPHLQCLLEEDKGQLLVCQRQCPDT